MERHDHSVCDWCGTPLKPITPTASDSAVETCYMLVSILPLPAPGHGSTWRLCPEHGAAVARFVEDAAWRATIDRALALAAAHGSEWEP